MSKGFKSLHFWLCPSGLNKPQTGHWKTGVYDSRNALESASALRTLAQYARPILLVSSLKASNLSKPSCILPVDEIQANAPPVLLPGWCGVVIYDSGLGLLFCFDEHSENGRIYGHVQLHVWWGSLIQAAGRPLRHYKNKALIPHVDCSMRQSRSSRFSQSVNSFNELKNSASVNCRHSASCLVCCSS